MNRLRFAVLAACLLASAALAYVLPGPSVVKRMVDARDDLRLSTLRVDGTAEFFDQAQMAAADALGIPPSNGELHADAIFTFHLPGRCRVDLLNEEQSRQAVISVNGRTKVEGAPLAAVQTALEQVCQLVELRTRGGEGSAEVFRHLAALGIETETANLGRFGGQVVYVLGDAAGDGPRFDVYKGTFMPARVRFNQDGQSWDVHFLDYGGPITGEWFPRVVEVYRNGQLELRFSSLRADSRVRLSDRLFSMAQ